MARWDQLEALARAIADGVPDPAVIVRPDESLVYCNRLFLGLIDHRQRSFERYLKKGGRVFEALSTNHEADRALLAQCLAENRTINDPWVTLETPNGLTLSVLRTLVPLPDADGTPAAVLAIYRDVSAEAAMHNEYKKALAAEEARAQELEFQVQKRTAELRAALEEVTRLSRSDPLTGALNRRAFTEYAEQALALSGRHGRSCAFLMTDLDFFKSVNDTYGHQAGDAILIAVSKQLGNLIRGSDKVARFGGEEFVVLLAETDAEAVAAIAERVRETVRALPTSEIVPGMTRPQTVSVGAAVFPDHGRTLDELVDNADKALYHAKTSGRDQVVLYTPELAGNQKNERSRDGMSFSDIRILAVDPDESRRDTIKPLFGEGFHVVFARDMTEAEHMCGRENFDTIILYVDAGSASEGAEFLRRSITTRPSAIRILVVDQIDDYTALRTAARGHIDHFLLADEISDHLFNAVHHGLARRELSIQEIKVRFGMSQGPRADEVAALQQVLAHGAIKMAYQPIICAETGDLRGYEALCRPQIPSMKNPQILLEAALATGSMWPLGELIREVVAEDAEAIPPEVLLFVNLHPSETKNPRLLDSTFSSELATRVVFELTERTAISDVGEIRAALQPIRGRGYRFAIDDLGAGYASLNSVALVGPEFIKIDMSLIRDIDTSARKRSLVASLVHFAKDADIAVIAEGIETEPEAAACRQLGCNLLQGYLFGKPAPLP